MDIINAELTDDVIARKISGADFVDEAYLADEKRRPWDRNPVRFTRKARNFAPIQQRAKEGA